MIRLLVSLGEGFSLIEGLLTLITTALSSSRDEGRKEAEGADEESLGYEEASMLLLLLFIARKDVCGAGRLDGSSSDSKVLFALEKKLSPAGSLRYEGVAS